ncbi:MAG TPA: hypothetical protein VK177_04455 [Flavobacteriales bacterium]|nr:hypothetical protein [Flavobacteriales bacterium]
MSTGFNLSSWIKPFAGKVIFFFWQSAKKEMNKQYSLFRFFQKNRYLFLAADLKDEFISVYFHAVLKYEQEKGKAFSRLFLFNEFAKQFQNYFNNESEYEDLVRLLDHTLHTSPYLIELKNIDVNIKGELTDFIKIFKQLITKVTNPGLKEASTRINLMLEDISEQITEIKGDNSAPDYTFLDQIRHKEEDKIPRVLVEFASRIETEGFETIPCLKAILNHQRIIVIGNGGTGKSTELQETCIKLKSLGYFPLMLDFKTYKNEQIEEILPKNWINIDQEKFIVFMDGLDEVEPSDFIGLMRKIKQFVQKNQSTKVVLSCRTNHFEHASLNNVSFFDELFKVFVIANLNLYESSVKAFLKNRYKIDYKNFCKEIEDKELYELTVNPFHLTTLASLYAEKGQLPSNKSDLFDQFIQMDMFFDQKKYVLTVDNITLKKSQTLSLLERIAVLMEIMGKNAISNSDFESVIDDSSKIDLIKYSKLFTKSENSRGIWKFEHRLFQEYLAARYLSKLRFDEIITLITYSPGHTKLIPSWMNTITFLLGIKNGTYYDDLITWLMKNDKELIIKVEREKLDIVKREVIFKEIFSYYQKNEFWINEYKLNLHEFTSFGNSKGCVEYLLNLLDEPSEITLRNAIRVLGNFNFRDLDNGSSVKKRLIELLDKCRSRVNIVSEILKALTISRLLEVSEIEHIFSLFGKSANKYIRTAMYDLILGYELSDKYVDYIISGCDLRYRTDSEERGGSTSMNEIYNLKECIGAVKTDASITKLINYASEGEYFRHHYDSGESARTLIKSAIEAENVNDNVFSACLSWFSAGGISFDFDIKELLVSYFVQTQSISKAIAQILRTENKRDRSYLLSCFVFKDTLDLFVELYNQKKIEKSDLQVISTNLYNSKEVSTKEFRNYLSRKTDLVFEELPQVDYNEIRRQQTIQEFELLFNIDSMASQAIEIFEDFKKEELTKSELYDILKINNRIVELEDKYNGAVLWLLRDMLYLKKDSVEKTIDKEKVELWFVDRENVERYCVGRLEQLLIHNDFLVLNQNQVQWIENWCNRVLSKFDFRTSLRRKGNTTTFNYYANYFFYFHYKLNFIVSEEVLLNMLSYSIILEYKYLNFDHLIKLIDNDKVNQRIKDNIEQGITIFEIFKNHFQYVLKNRLYDFYTVLEAKIENENWSEYEKRELINLYYEETLDKEYLKRIISKCDSGTIWEIIKKLSEVNEEEFIKDFLVNEEKRRDDISFKINACYHLVIIDNEVGIQLLIDLVNSHWKSHKEEINYRSLSNVTSIRVLPGLFELLKLSYEVEESEDKGYFNSSVLSAYHKIGIQSEQNLKIVKDDLNRFLSEYRDKYPKSRFILEHIDGIEDKYYESMPKIETIEEAKRKLAASSF